MNDQLRTQIGMCSFSTASYRALRRLTGLRTLLPITLALLTSSLWGQLKPTTYSQPPAVVVEPVIVKLSGVYPPKIVRPQGPFVLYVENRLPGHIGHFSLQLDPTNASGQTGSTTASTNAPELTTLDTTASQARSSILLDLLPGTYKLYIQTQGNNPTGWSVSIQIGN